MTYEQVTDALKQVAQAADTFGGSYSSTDLVFPGAQDDGGEEVKPRKSDKKKV